jgi:predicted nucleic acid-binding protein
VPHRVFVDSNVFVSRTIRDWLFLLRQETDGMFQTHSTVDVIAESVRAVRRIRPRLDGAITHELQRRLIHNLDELQTSFDGTIPFAGSDRDDFHVHAAAVASRADILLTSNGRDFGDPATLPYDVWTPDEFFVLVDDSAPAHVARVTADQHRYWSAKSSKRDLADALVAADCPRFAARVARHVHDPRSGSRPRTAAGPSRSREHAAPR